MKKWIIRLVIVIIVLIVLLVLGVGLFLDSAIKKGVEIIGPKVTKVDVKLQSVRLSIFSGSGRIQGLVVGNPPGYKTPSSIDVGSASLGLDPKTVLSGKVVIHTIDVENPQITLEQQGLSGNNLRAIQGNLSQPGGAETETAASGNKPGKKLEVDDFVIRGAKLNVSAAALGQNLSQTIPLPEIHLQDLGKGSEGITASELTKVVLSKVLEVAVQQGESVASDLIKHGGSLPKNLGLSNTNLSNSAKGVLDLLKKK